MIKYFIKFAFVLFNLLIAFCLYAQEDSLYNEGDSTLQYLEELHSEVAPGDYPFIMMEYNSIVTYQQNGLQSFFKKLQQLETQKNRKVNIVHIGDSHIQADLFSGKLREMLQNDRRFGNGGRGFVYPYTAAHTNNPWNYKTTITGVWEGARSVKTTIQSQWGLAGITATTHDPNATITINPNFSGNQYTITRVKVFYPVFDETSFDVTVNTDEGNFIHSYLSRDGFVEFTFRKPQSKITISFMKSNPRQNKFIIQGITLENDNAGIVYTSTGVNGAEVPTYFRCEDFEKHLSVLKPDLIIVSLGTNDAFRTDYNSLTFKNNLRYFIEEIKETCPGASILLTTPNDSYYKDKTRRRKSNPQVEDAVDQIHIVAKEMDTAVWDFYELMGGFKSIDKWHKVNLAQADKLHLTAGGYQLQGKLLYNALNNAYRDYLAKQKNKK